MARINKATPPQYLQIPTCVIATMGCRGSVIRSAWDSENAIEPGDVDLDRVNYNGTSIVSLSKSEMRNFCLKFVTALAPDMVAWPRHEGAMYHMPWRLGCNKTLMPEPRTGRAEHLSKLQ